MKNLGPFLPAFRHLLGPMGSRAQDHLRKVRQATLSQIEDRLCPALPAELFKNFAGGDFSRDRVYTLARTFWCWIWQVLQANTSCRAVVRQVQALFAARGGAAVDQATGGYCSARRNLPLTWLVKIFAAVFQSAEAAAPQGKLLQGRPLRMVDGSGARLADTPKNRQASPPSKNLPKGTGFPYMRILCLFSAVSGAILARATGSLHNCELELTLSLLGQLQKNDILVGDRAYGIYLMAALLQLLGIDLIARVSASRRIDFRTAKAKFGPNDRLMCWNKPVKASVLVRSQKWQQLPWQITLRLIRLTIQEKGFRTHQLTIVTTLLDPQLYPAQEILAAYLKRWRMEMCFDDLKTTLHMEQLTCLWPNMVEKELIIFLTAHNFLRWIMAEAARTEEVPLERISFKGTLDGFREWTQAIAQLGCSSRHKRKRAALWKKFLQTLAADLVPERPGRCEPRAVKRRSKYPYLNKPRHKYVDRWSRKKRRRMATARKNAALN